MGKHRERSEERHHRKHKKEKKHKKDKEPKTEKRRYDELPPLPGSIPYTDTNNPFNDTNLTETFIWGKKLKLEGKDNLSKKAIERLNREKVYRNIEEMEKLKRERDARQSAREDLEMIARDEEKSQNADWRRVESAFHLNQAKLRSVIRVKENRPMPSDLLLRYISFGEPRDDDIKEEYEDFELEQPTKYIKNLSVSQFEDLLEDIKVMRKIDKGQHTEFWNDVATLAKFELKKLTNDRADENIHSSVMTHVLASFEKKSFAELTKMEKEINDKIKDQGRGIDVSFWEEALDLLRPKMARTRLKELHSKKMKLRLEQIRAEQKKATETHEKEHNVVLPSASSSKATIPAQETIDEDKKPDLQALEKKADETLKKDDIDAIQAYDMSRPLPFTVDMYAAMEDEQKEQKWSQLSEAQANRFVLEMYKAGAYSPKYIDESQAMPGIDIIDETEDAKKLHDMRHKKEEPVKPDESRMMGIAKMGMAGDESAFAVEENIGHQDLLWADKFRPQKPKYFNRVQTGFDWNKYNQTHYDMDNPPPKIVQGYRFNIFYPDLLDPTNTPGFTLTECKNEPDFAILRFHAGPPYEDIAFKIVHREWEANHKQGYKCQFASGVFQLWFSFKRYRYRR